MALGLAACDALLGLGKYAEPYCIDAGDAADCPDAGSTLEVRDVQVEGDGGGSADATLGDGAAYDAQLGDVVVEAPSPLQLWAQWPMPNPNAPAGADSSALLPNPMKYDLSEATDGGDAGNAEDAGDASDDGDAALAGTVKDLVTHLVWERYTTTSVSSAATAAEYCAGKGMRLPTRIELISLIDFTQTPPPLTNQTVFPQTKPAQYWTSSAFPKAEGGLEPWLVNFGTGEVEHTAPGFDAYVRCVSGPTP